MLTINLQNIEELILSNNSIRQQLPEFEYYFNQWKLGKMIPALKQSSKRAVLSVLNNLNEEHMKIIESVLKNKVVLEKIDEHIVKNYLFHLDTCEKELNEMECFSNFCLNRDTNKVYISFWR